MGARPPDVSSRARRTLSRRGTIPLRAPLGPLPRPQTARPPTRPGPRAYAPWIAPHLVLAGCGMSGARRLAWSPFANSRAACHRAGVTVKGYCPRGCLSKNLGRGLGGGSPPRPHGGDPAVPSPQGARAIERRVGSGPLAPPRHPRGRGHSYPRQVPEPLVSPAFRRHPARGRRPER